MPPHPPRQWLSLVAAVLAVLVAACTPEVVGSAAAASSPTPTVAEAVTVTPSPTPSETVSEAPPPPAETATVTPSPLAAAVGLADTATGAPVELLQQRLSDLGYRTGGVDGAFGPMTAVAVRVFQHDHGLPASGVVDAATVAALDAATPAEVLSPGSEGPAVVALQQQLSAWHFDPGEADGRYGTRTAQAVYALQKLHGQRAEGSFGPIERYLMATGEGRRPRLAPDQNTGMVVEIDIPAQLVSVYANGQPVLYSHTSTASGETFCTPAGGCRRAVTPRGSYTISRRIDGWRTSELGELYNPLYFNGGIALHGSLSIPTSPASHGCVRLPMHIAEYAPDLLPNGTTVIVG